jgi:hypothetical protein
MTTLTRLGPVNPSIDACPEVPDLDTLDVDPVLGFARVISQVKANTSQFRGWGPNH